MKQETLSQIDTVIKYIWTYDIKHDYDKIKRYTEDLKTDCNYYLATIWEYEDKATSWTRKNAAWAKGKLTELNASYEKDEMRFYICEHQ